MFRLTLLLLLLSLKLFSSEITLKERLWNATPGSYVVLQQNKTFTFLHIFEKTASTIVLEEVSIPVDAFKRQNRSWKEWFEGGGYLAGSWTLSEISLESGRLIEGYSFTQMAWLDVAHMDPFISTLFNLTFHEESEANRRRIGAKKDGAIWNPKLFNQGELIPNIAFNAYKGRWPEDGSELASRSIEIYLPQQELSDTFPTYFPYWMEIEGKVNGIRIRVVDSGTFAESPKHFFPSRRGY